MANGMNAPYIREEDRLNCFFDEKEYRQYVDDFYFRNWSSISSPISFEQCASAIDRAYEELEGRSFPRIVDEEFDDDVDSPADDDIIEENSDITSVNTRFPSPSFSFMV